MGKKKAAITGQLSDIDLRQLRIFKTVVEAGGFSAAEPTLNLANSTISNYIADLEKRLDMHLCERGRAGFRITEQGKVVYEATMELLHSLESFKSKINQSHQKIVGNLHLGFAEHMLGKQNKSVVNALAMFTRSAPDVNLQITTMGSDDVTGAVLNNAVDMGITVLSHPYSDLHCLTLFTEEMQLYCGQSHPLFSRHSSAITSKDLQQYAFVESARLLPGREPFAEIVSWNKKARAHHQEARTMLILSGEYLGYLPKHLVASWGLEYQLKPLLPEKFNYTNKFEAIRKKQARNHAAVSLFFDCLQSNL
ncbi:LysR family transcriptional regulator [Paraneptunicella aestuarii]|uniref:LysR family transcriptional regulator n=1 Tax=Paraneptunicella aestuarii TaxID=2831148 RepID=UPI001E50F5D9|nr:LysR family transcriptional regulator [Paraneptunicella aestuarii]UAA39611.1 LysR family transcriptional regulator [Paraneptunicella aestuarii]